VNFGTAAGIGPSQYFIDHFGQQPTHNLKIRVKVTAVDANTVAIEVQTRDGLGAPDQPPPRDEWIPAGVLHVAYGSAGAIELVDRSSASAPGALLFRTHVVLRPQRLREEL
jgi:hypothetical protein